MKDFNWYADRAKKRNNIRSNNKLADAIGITSSSITNLSKGRAIPTDETMSKLAELAGIDEQTAFMHVNMWRAPTPEIRNTYSKILQTLQHATLTIFLAVVGFTGLSTDVSASPTLPNDNVNSIYYGKCGIVIK